MSYSLLFLLPVNTNLRVLKFALITFGWVWSKMVLATVILVL